MRRDGLDGGCWPDDRQDAVLRAALRTGPAAARAWREADLDLAADLDPEVDRLLGLMGANLGSEAMTESEWAVVRRSTLRTLASNTSLIRHTLPALAALSDRGVRFVVLKGLALTELYLGGRSTRPMADIDVLVHPDWVDPALDTLEAAGWRHGYDRPRSELRTLHHGSGMHRGPGDLDVHWVPGFALHAGDERATTVPFFERPEPFELDGLDLQAAAPDLLLLQVMGHGVRARQPLAVRWVIDAAAIVRGREDLDWDRFVAEVERRPLAVLPVRNGVAYLRTVSGSGPPDLVVDALDALAVGRHARRVFSIASGQAAPGPLLGRLKDTRADFALTSARWSWHRRLRELPAFLRVLWELDAVRHVPAEAVAKAGRRVRGLVAGGQAAGEPVRGGPRPTLAVVVPSVDRPERLRDCLDAIARQTDTPNQTIVVRRADDEATKEVVRSRPEAVMDVVTPALGLPAALHAGLRAADADVVAFTDDDARPWTTWCERLRDGFGDPTVMGLGGRDVVIEAGRVVTGDAGRVGVIRWWGQVVGAHHLGRGPARDVDHLKGVNMAYRRAVVAIPVGLRGSGSVMYNEMAVGLHLRAEGHRLVYDPALVVDHEPGERAVDDAAGRSTGATADTVYNQNRAIFSRAGGGRRRLVYALMIGDSGTGGALRCVIDRVAGPGHLAQSFRPFAKATLEAWADARRGGLQFVGADEEWPVRGDGSRQ